MRKIRCDAVRYLKFFLFAPLDPDPAVCPVAVKFRTSGKRSPVKEDIVPGIIGTDIVPHDTIGIGIIDSCTAAGTVVLCPVAPQTAVFNDPVPGVDCKTDADAVQKGGHIPDGHIFLRSVDNDPPRQFFLRRRDTLVSIPPFTVKTGNAETFKKNVTGAFCCFCCGNW